MRYLSRLQAERRAEHDRLGKWLAGEVGRSEGVIDAFLFLVDGHPELNQALNAADDPTEGKVWLPSAQLLAYSDRLDYLQVSRDDKVDAAITLSNAKLYRSRAFPIGKDLAWVVLDENTSSKNDWRQAYLGVWFPSNYNSSEDLGFEPSLEISHTLLLFDPLTLLQGKGHFTNLMKDQGDKITQITFTDVPHAGKVAYGLVASLSAAEAFLDKQFGGKEEDLTQYLEKLGSEKDHIEDSLPISRIGELSRLGLYSGEASEDKPVMETAFASTLTRELKRANALELIGTLGFLASIDALWTSPFSPLAPLGATRVEEVSIAGTAVLSKDVFSKKSLWDAKKWFEEHPPKEKRVPVASEFGFLTAKEAAELTVVNTMELKAGGLPPSYLTLGVSLKPIVMTLAQITGDANLLIYEGQVLLQISGEGRTPLPSAVKRDLEIKGKHLKEPTGFVELGGMDYYYSTYHPKLDWDLYFITLEPASEALAPIKIFEAHAHKMAHAVTKHIILISLGVLLLALVVLEILARRFTKPISKLAAATEHVSAGHYEHIELPKVKKHSKNEIAVLTYSFTKMIQGLQDREKIRGVLDKVVSKEIADEILHGNVRLGGEVREVCVLFADIRSFTQITANLPPEEVITFVNAYMNEMTQIIETYQGVIDKYVGDEVMALFGAPISHKHAPLQAVLAAITIRDKLTQWNEERKEKGLFTCHVGIGVHFGPMVAGNMGAEDRLNYTVLGSNVNLASRLCDLALEKEILISEAMAQEKQIQDTMTLKKRDRVKIKGFEEPVFVYSVEGLKPGFLLGDLSQIARELKGQVAESEES